MKIVYKSEKKKNEHVLFLFENTVYIKTHRDCDSIHKACTGPDQAKF